MKKKALLFGLIPAIAIVAGLFVYKSSFNEGNYEQRLSSHLDVQEALVGGTYEIYHRMKGDFTKEDWNRANVLASSINKDRSVFNWIDQGPDNWGGRTRAIVVDRNNINHLYVGSVSGGLYESINGGNVWHRVENFTQSLAISSMCQTIDGTFYVATGHQQELTDGSQAGYATGANGFGVYKSEVDGSWTLIEDSDNYSYINEIRCDDVHNKVWIAGNLGLKTYSPGGTLEDVDAFAGTGSCNSLSISNDGTVIIGHAVGDGPSAVRVSTNSGVSFTEVSAFGEDEGLINMISVSRIEFAISHEKVDGKYRVYGSAASSQLRGIWRSPDNGITWFRIAPAYDGTPGGFSPFTATAGGSGQGSWDNIITVVPGAPERIIIGGIDCYSWSTTDNWEQISQWWRSVTNSRYVHADNHEFVWNANGRLYIGNDGGVSFSDDAQTSDPTFHTANRGYNVFQVFASGVSGHGDVIGGSQDNGSKANYHTGTTFREHKNVGGGDGFSTDISFTNRNLLFSSIYGSGVYRASDRGQNRTNFFPEQFNDRNDNKSGCLAGASNDGCGQFFTNFELWENPNDLESKDTLRYIPTEDYEIGDTVFVPSSTSQMSIIYVTDVALVFDDTLYYNEDLTVNDTVVVDELTGFNYNLGILNWSFIYGEPVISVGDTILLIGDGEIVDDTIVVESYTLEDHYFGTSPSKPGQFVDMGVNTYILNVAWDTILVQDHYQSWFAFDIGRNFSDSVIFNGIWLTRNALRFSAPTQGWIRILNLDDEDNLGLIVGDIASMEFSKNGDYLFLGTWDGRIYRYSGFADVYSPIGVSEDPVVESGVRIDTIFDYKGDAHVARLELIGGPFGSPVTGIASGPIADPDLLVITLGNFAGSGKVRRSTNATGISPSFSTLSAFPTFGAGAAAIGIPCYSVIVDRIDPNIIVVGTEFGVYATEDGGSTWSNVSGEFGSTPVYDMQQNWRQWDEGCKRPGEIYLGTHGAGIWSTDAFLSIPEQGDNLLKEKFAPNIKLYPNPMNDAGIIEFSLEKNEDVLLQIFNINGQVVHQVMSKNLVVGSNKIAFDVYNLPTGTYIVKLSSDSMTETTKFIKR